MVAISLGVLCLVVCVNWAHGQEPTRGFAVMRGSVEDGPGVAVDTAGAAVIHRTGVEYPHALIGKRIEGTVSVEAKLDTTGNVVDAHVLSGPEELRKAALSSVLNWHFTPGSGNTRVVQIAFHPPDQVVETEPERKEAGQVMVRVPATYTVRTDQGEIENKRVVGWKADAERRQMGMTSQFLAEELEKSRERLSQMESQPDTHSEDLTKARLQSAELEQKLAASRQAEEMTSEPQREPSVELKRSLERLRALAAVERDRHQLVGSKVAAIEIRGLSDAAGNDLLTRLPVHEGDTLTEQSIEGVRRAIRQFDEHLEFGYGWEPEGAVMRIHPAGAAGAPLLIRK
jgi:TonB family protein